MFNFSIKPIGIACSYDENDPRLKNKVEIHCSYAGKGIMKNRICHKTVSVTEAEKAVIESIAMRLFLDHKKVVRRVPSKKEGMVTLQGVICVDVDL